MENLIFARVIGGLFLIINVFIGYASTAVWHPLDKKLVNGFYALQALAITVVFIYDGFATPFKDGVFLAIVGYAFVYLVLFAGYVLYSHFTTVSINKIYLAEVGHQWLKLEGKLFICCKIANNNYYYESEAYIPFEQLMQEPEDKEKDSAQNYKEWFIDGKLNKKYLKHNSGEIIGVKFREYLTRNKLIIVDVA